MLVKRLVGSVFCHAYLCAIQSAREPLASASAKSVKQMPYCCMRVSSVNRALPYMVSFHMHACMVT